MLLLGKDRKWWYQTHFGFVVFGFHGCIDYMMGYKWYHYIHFGQVMGHNAWFHPLLELTEMGFNEPSVFGSLVIAHFQPTPAGPKSLCSHGTPPSLWRQLPPQHILPRASAPDTNWNLTLQSIDWFKGKNYRKIPYFMGKSMVSCRFSLQLIHWLTHWNTRNIGTSGMIGAIETSGHWEWSLY